MLALNIIHVDIDLFEDGKDASYSDGRSLRFKNAKARKVEKDVKAHNGDVSFKDFIIYFEALIYQ